MEHLLKVLEATRGLLQPPTAWIKGHTTTAADGHPVGYWDPRACRFSLEGALLRVGYISRTEISPAYNHLKGIIHPKRIVSLANWNDAEGTTHQAVLHLLNRAIVPLGGEAISLYPGDEDES